jgi:Na+/proline symporter
VIKEIVKWRPIIIGIVLVVTLYVISDLISGVSILLPSFLLAGLVVGFIINESEKNGAINGAILGLIGGLIVNVFLILYYYYLGYGDYISSILLYSVMNLVLQIVVATVGGVLGSLIKTESVKNRPVEDSVEE